MPSITSAKVTLRLDLHSLYLFNKTKKIISVFFRKGSVFKQESRTLAYLVHSTSLVGIALHVLEIINFMTSLEANKFFNKIGFTEKAQHKL